MIRPRGAAWSRSFAGRPTGVTARADGAWLRPIQPSIGWRSGNGCACLRRRAVKGTDNLSQDTTGLSYNTLKKTVGLGSVGDSRNPGRGLWLHSMQAFRADGIPLGCAQAKVWARPQESDTDRRNEQSICEKESVRWIEAYQSAARLARSMPQTQLTVCGDRELDIFELFDQSPGRADNLHLLVRAQHDRLLSDGHKLWQELSRKPVGGTVKVRVGRSSAAAGHLGSALGAD